MDVVATKCAKSIAHLYMLHSVPVQPHANPLSNLPNFGEGYVLPFEKEQLLAGVLAFLSGIEENPNYVTAVCIKENHETSSLDVLLAVNKGKPNDGESILEELNKGFEKLFAVLSQVSDGTLPNNIHLPRADRAFAAIVSMCSHRILCRLRLNEKPTMRARGRSPKPSIKIVLERTCESLEEAGMSSRFPLFVATVKGVEKLVDAWTQHQTQQELEALVEGFCRLQRLEDVNSVLEAMPDRPTFPKASKRSLLNIINKVARYRDCARFLCRLARKYPLIRQMRVVPTRLPPEIFQKPTVGQLEPDLASKMPSKESRKRNQAGPVGTMCRLLGYGTFQKAEQEQLRQAQKTLREAKIHAEIQLLFYCHELEKPELPPRVVCSSKDACFLCNTFIATHGKMHTPKSHGRLYTGWRLPRAGNIDLHSRFVQYLDGLIMDSVAMLLLRRTKAEYPDPNESTLLTLPVSISTLSNREGHHDDLQADRNSSLYPSPETIEKAEAEASAVALKSPKVSSHSPRSDEKLTTIVEERKAITSPEVNEVCSSSASPISSLSELLSSITTEGDGQTSGNAPLPETVGANMTSQFYSDGVLEVHVEYSTGNAASGGLSKQLPFSVEWLGAEEAERAREVQGQYVFDAVTLESETPVSLNDQNSMYISAKGSLVKLTFGRPQSG
ncbi:uncharacterized protein PG986_009908 [Apiospora aurea]|uniref:Uncharacterized protein n=1 Tax=Apiospora aurea TaxID=335848 RepID=A0ABR1Q911_9PEZI